MAISCDVSMLAPSGPAFPTPAPGVVDTIVAGTAGAAQTQTALLVPATPTPTFTATITRTPTVTPTFTPTFIFQLRSPVPTKNPTSTSGPSSAGLACRLLSQSPKDGTKLAPNKQFDAVWEVENSGTTAWDAGSIDFAYATGRKMHEEAVYDLLHNVDEGESVQLAVAMTAPKVSGSYTTVWTLRRGGNDFCHVDLTITVK